MIEYFTENKLIQTILKSSLRENAGRRGVKASASGASFFVHFPAFRPRFEGNRIKNAIYYSYPDTEIIVSGKKVQANIVITFQNQGKTIPQQKLVALFDKFFRLDDARTSNTGGTGLGLAIAKDIVNLHGGNITAESQDEITIFTITLPS